MRPRIKISLQKVATSADSRYAAVRREWLARKYNTTASHIKELQQCQKTVAMAVVMHKPTLIGYYVTLQLWAGAPTKKVYFSKQEVSLKGEIWLQAHTYTEVWR